VAFPINQVPSWKFTSGHPAPLIALVHHRMVGTLSSTDATFTTGKRVASSHFGIGLCSKHGGSDRICIHQYVLLGNQAFANGNNKYTDPPRAGQLVPSAWNKVYPTTLVNSRTVSIEHQDNGMKGHPKRGIVPEEVIGASIWLDGVLLSGEVTAMQAAGIRFRAGSEAKIAKELKAIRPGPNTMVDHHYISGPLKPSCWRPWKQDKVGFPQARYIREVGASVGMSPTRLAPDPTPRGSTIIEGDVVKSFTTPTVPTLAKVRSAAWLYDNSALEPSPKNIQIDPGREMPLLGVIGQKSRIVSYVNAAGTVVGQAYWVEAADVESTRPGPA
jgi:hypothetical protein